MDVGSELRSARERRLLSIEDLSRRTKIKATILSAIDRNDVAHLPGGIFTRAFVKQYASEVGLDPSDIVPRFEAQFMPEPVVAPASAAEPTRIDIHDVVRDDRTSEPLRVDDIRLLVLAGAVVLAVTSYIGFNRSHVQALRTAPNAVAAVNVSSQGAREIQSAVQPTPVGTSGSVKTTTPATMVARTTSTAAHTSSAAAPIASALRVDLRPRALCWITATADGKRTEFRLLNAGERVTLNASRELVLRVGDAASLELSVNGSRGRPLGGRGQAVTIRLTPANYREFVAP
jgi:cytoskeleton protein RodZ